MANDLSNVCQAIPRRETIFSREDLNIRIYVMQDLFSSYLPYSLRILKNLSFSYNHIRHCQIQPW